MKNVLVTGGAGYVGSHAVRILENAGYRAWVYDNLSRGHRAAAPAGRLIEADLHQHDRLEDAFARHEIDAVLHFAAHSQVGESVVDPAIYYENNVAGTLSLLEAMRRCDVWRIVVSSTSAVYGSPEKVPISEDAPRRPINPYGFSKRVMEQMLADYAQAYGLGFAALRYFNASGAAADGSLGEDHTPETHLIPLVLQVALGRRDSISIFGDDYPTPDGTCVRDYVHVDDLARAHVAALEKLQQGKGLSLNLGMGRGFSVAEVVAACRQVTGHEIPAVVSERRAGDPAELVADASRAGVQLDWQPEFTEIEPIVETAWRWMKEHPEGYGAPDLV